MVMLGYVIESKKYLRNQNLQSVLAENITMVMFGYAN